ncbi:MAG: glycoside hydrolase family 28 protein [Bryobacteraceae bacterium]
MKLFPLLSACIVSGALVTAYGQDTRKITEPKIPPSCTVLTAGLTSQGTTVAESDEGKLDTARIQQALDRCKPGQAVELKAGGGHDAFLSAPLQLRQGVTLLVDRGAILFASRNPRDYDLEASPGVCGTITEHGHACKSLINGDGVADAAVMGDGIVDGRGGAKIMGQNGTWWDLAEKARSWGVQNVPRIMLLSHCNNFVLYRIQLRNSPNFHVLYSGGNGFTAWGVIVNSPRNARNTDGINPGNSTNVTITHCYIHAGDDNVAIKTPEGEPTSHISVVHNHFYAGHGMSIGSTTAGGASAIRVSDLTIDGADNGIRIKSNITLGGLVHDVEYDDVCIRNTRNPILMDSNYNSLFGPEKNKPPQFTDIRLNNVLIQGGGRITLDGLDAAHRLGISFHNVVLEQPEAIKITAVHADIQLDGSNIAASGDDVKVSGEPSKGKPDACAGRFVPFPVPISVK